MQVHESEFYHDHLWTAPELLRMTNRPINGTQKADVYSFAIILQEIMFRAMPYFVDIDYPTGMDIVHESRFVAYVEISCLFYRAIIVFYYTNMQHKTQTKNIKKLYNTTTVHIYNEKVEYRPA